MRRQRSASSPGTTKLSLDDLERDDRARRPVTAADVLAMLGEQMEVVQRDKEMNTVTKARLLAPLAALALKAITIAHLEAEVQAVKEILQRRTSV